MAYLPPVDWEPSTDSAGFWAWCDQRRLMFQQCKRCRHVVHPPLPMCPQCQSMEHDWTEAPAQARVFSYTWIYSAAHDAVKDSLPYNSALVEFPELPEVRIVTNIVDVQPGGLAFGDAVTLAWEDGGNGHSVPRFRKGGAAP